MEEGLLLVNDDFVILRKKDVFSYDGLTAVKSFSHSVSDKLQGTGTRYNYVFT